MRNQFVIAGMLICFCAMASSRGAVDPQLRRWTDRLIPLPKEIAVDSSITVPADKIKIAEFTPAPPRAATALWLLKTMTAGGAPENPEITFSLHLVGESPAVPADLAERLAGLPNSGQAYALAPRPDKRQIMLIANQPEGLLYAARTMLQLIARAPRDVNPATEIEIPWVNVVDWPDMQDRGTYCGAGGFDSYENDFKWMGRWKLNFAYRDADAKIDNIHAPEAEMFGTYEPIIGSPSKLRRLITAGAYAGVRVQTALGHLEQTCLGGHGLLQARRDPKMEKYLPALARQDPKLKFDPYMVGLSMSSPVTIDILTAWLAEIAGVTEGYSDRITVCLTENRTYCHDDMLKSTAEKGFYDHYVSELEAVMEAMHRVRRQYPWLKYDIILSQGCRLDDTRRRLLEMVPADVGVHYYDGTLTYTSGKDEIIFPRLAEFAGKGGRAGVVPTITHACTAVVPWTGIDYIHFRCNEFVDKKLQLVMAFLQPDRYHCEQELMALAEWSWNAKGRTPAEFAAAYATVTGICDPETYAQWAVKASNAGWLLADSRFLADLPQNPAQGFYANQTFGDNLYKDKDINHPDKYHQGWQDAAAALALAYETGAPEMITESEAAFAGLSTYKTLKEISAMLHEDMDVKARADAFAGKLNDLDEYANLYRNALQEWTYLNLRKRAADGLPQLHHQWLGRHMPGRLQLTADALRRLAEPLGIPDPRPLSRGVEVATWDLEPAVGFKTFEYELSEYVPVEGGWFNLSARIGTPGTQLLFGKCEIYQIMPDGGAETPVARWQSAAIPFYIPARDPGARLVVRHAMRTHHNRPGQGAFVLTRVYGRNDFPRGGEPVIPSAGETLVKIAEVYPPAPARDQPVRVGVLHGLAGENLAETLRKEQWLAPVLLEAPSPENLAQCSVLIFGQMAAQPERMLDWAPAVKSWVRNGGGVMFLHDAVGYRAHMAMFPEGGHGVDHPKHNRVKVVRAHPITAGLGPGAIFTPGFAYDHVVMEKGAAGEVLLVSEGDNRPVFIIGEYGRGRYILNGMLTGAPAGKNVSKGGQHDDGDIGSEEERNILLNGIKWLTPRAGPAADGAGNMMKNPGAEEIIAYSDYPKHSPHLLPATDMVPPGWGAYRGVGRGTWGSSKAESHSGARSAFLQFNDWQESDGEKSVQLGLLLGEGCGYRHPGAMACKPNTDYVFSVWLKGNVPIVKMSVMGWDQAGKRETILLKTLSQAGKLLPQRTIQFGFPPAPDWSCYEGTFATNAETVGFHVAIFIPNAPFLQPGQSVFIDDAVILPAGT